MVSVCAWYMFPSICKTVNDHMQFAAFDILQRIYGHFHSRISSKFAYSSFRISQKWNNNSGSRGSKRCGKKNNNQTGKRIACLCCFSTLNHKLSMANRFGRVKHGAGSNYVIKLVRRSNTKLEVNMNHIMFALSYVAPVRNHHVVCETNWL